MARPSKMTAESARRIIEAVRQGLHLATAGRLGGVSYSTLRRWLIEGEAAKTGRFREFWKAVNEAESQAEASMATLWAEAAPSDWRAARDFLARRWPERWGAPTTVSVAGAEKSAIHIYLPDNGRDPKKPVE